MTEAEKRALAWIGDAVLGLFARQWILGRTDIPPGKRAEVFGRLTSNQFLSAVGEPTGVEAEIGRIYESEGLEAAFAHIEATLLPVFRKQENNRRRGG